MPFANKIIMQDTDLYSDYLIKNIEIITTHI